MLRVHGPRGLVRDRARTGQIVGLHRVHEDGTVARVDDHRGLVIDTLGSERLQRLSPPRTVYLAHPADRPLALVSPDASRDEVDHESRLGHNPSRHPPIVRYVPGRGRHRREDIAGMLEL